MARGVLQVLGGGLVLTIAVALVASVGVKYFARPLPYSRAFLIALIAFAVSTALTVLYFVTKFAIGLPDTVDGLVTLVSMAVAGTVITRLARKHGIEKTGWLGVGAKSILLLIGLSWIMMVVVYAGLQLLRS
jgi:hypothetical protein